MTVRNSLIKLLCCCGLFFGLSLSLLAQSSGYRYNSADTTFQLLAHRNGFGPTLGYRGAKANFLELGVTFAQVGHGIVGWELNYLSNLKFNDHYIHGVSLGYYKGFAIFEVGINATSYTDHTDFNATVRPHIDLGIGGVLVVGYGYNISLWHSPINQEVNKHELRVMARWAIGAF